MVNFSLTEAWKFKTCTCLVHSIWHLIHCRPDCQQNHIPCSPSNGLNISLGGNTGFQTLKYKWSKLEWLMEKNIWYTYGTRKLNCIKLNFMDNFLRHSPPPIHVWLGLRNSHMNEVLLRWKVDFNISWTLDEWLWDIWSWYMK
jgi:hypothetical protein